MPRNIAISFEIILTSLLANILAKVVSALKQDHICELDLHPAHNPLKSRRKETNKWRQRRGTETQQPSHTSGLIISLTTSRGNSARGIRHFCTTPRKNERFIHLVLACSCSPFPPLPPPLRLLLLPPPPLLLLLHRSSLPPLVWLMKEPPSAEDR